MTFQQLAKAQKKILAKQRPLTYEEALENQKKIKAFSKSKHKKGQ